MLALAVLYPVGLVVLVLLFRFVGERWWVTAIAIFLPRIGFGLPLVVLVPALLWLRERRWLWSQAVALLVLVFPLMGLVLPAPGPSAGPNGFRLLSFNVDSSQSGKQEVFQRIVDANPDVVLLQESTDGSLLHELFKKRYPHVEVSTQFLVASRFPIVATTSPKRIDYEGRDRSPRFLRHVIRTPLGPVTFFNVHPVSPRDNFYELRGRAGFTRELRSGRFFAGAAAPTIASNAGLRALQIETFGKMASGENGPVVLAGDVNQPDPSPLVENELGAFRDGFREGGWGFGYTFPASQFKGRRTPKVPWMRLDRILLRGPIVATRFSVGCAGVSDHLCVVADLASKP